MKSISKVHIWLNIIIAVGVALAANTISTIWAGKESLLNPWLIVVLLISPLVFITFGLVTAKLGLAVSSATIDSLLTISSIMVGLLLFGGWREINAYQYVGMICALVGIFIMQYRK